jgi:RNA polymerase sigma factor (sigma-70 family)
MRVGAPAGRRAQAAAARVADPAIVVNLEATHGQQLLGFVRTLGLPYDVAHDCVQETMLRLWAEIQRGTAIENPRAWAYRTAYRVAMDEHRIRRRVTAIAQRLSARGDTARIESNTIDQVVVWQEVDRLPMRQRQVVYLRYATDLAYDDIATILGITASAARTHATLAMPTLRRRLEAAAGTEEVR